MSKCPKCEHSIFCETWGEYKCFVKGRRIYDFEKIEDCADFHARGVKVKDPDCQCDDCMTNAGYDDED